MRKQRSNSATVMVVEDDDSVRSVVVRGLKRDGYTVLEETGTSPIDFSHFPKLDVLLCDVGLPKESGYTVAERCRQTWPDCEVILLSGHIPEELERRGVPPHTNIVQKPISVRELSDLMQKLLTLRAWRALRTD
jgi:CheY-like chemotaxis protein